MTDACFRPPMYGAERPAMNKLLAYGYAKEWEPVRDIWYHKIQAGIQN